MADDNQKLVKVNGLGVVAFPATMGDDQISSALQKHLQSRQASAQPDSGLPKGMLEQGNIDVNHRPVIWNDDGTPSTVFSATVPISKNRWALVPTIADGKFLTPNGKMPAHGDTAAARALEQAALDNYKKTGQHLGVFNSQQAADSFATATHAWMPNGGDEQVFIPKLTPGNSNMPVTRPEYEQAIKQNLASSLTQNPKGEGLYTMYGSTPTQSDPNAVGAIQIPYSSVPTALQRGYTWYGQSGEQYAKDKAAEGKPASWWGTVNEKIQKALTPVSNQNPNPFKREGLGNTDRAFLNVLYSTPGFLKELGQAYLNGGEDENRHLMDLIDPGTMIGGMKEQFQSDWKRDPQMAIDNLKGQLAGLYVVGKATHAATGFLGPKDIPPRINTRVVHANPAGEVRIGPDSIPTIWMHPDAFNEYMKVTHPEETNPQMILGENVPVNENFQRHATAPGLSDHPAWGHVQDLLQNAQTAAPGGSAVITPRAGTLSNAVRVLREEKIHSWQRGLANGNLSGYLDPQTFNNLATSVPDATRKTLSDVYGNIDNATLVNEVAARYIANDLHGASPGEAVQWLSNYFDSVAAQHGPEALDRLGRTRGLSSALKEVIANEHRNANAGTAQANAAAQQVGPAGRPEPVRTGVPPIAAAAPAYQRSGPAASEVGGWQQVGAEAPAAISNENGQPQPALSNPQPGQNAGAFQSNAFSKIAELRQEAEDRSKDWLRAGAQQFGNINTDRYLQPDFRAKAIADAYEAMQHNPSDPRVAASYGALKHDINDQWNYATRNLGVTFEPWTKEGQPYNNSAEMTKDVQDNHHLYFFQGGEVPSDHPMAEINPETGYSYNDMLRGVHDLFGHAMESYQFGPRGEENAWNAHSQMFSPEALPALTSETKGQNSWVNYGPQMRDAAGNLLKPGDPGYLPPQQRAYAENKAGILPERFHYRLDTPTGFVSPNTFDLNLGEAQTRLGSYSQRLFANVSSQLGQQLGVNTFVNSALGHWQGGAENSIITHFPINADPDAVAYHSAMMAKLGRQNFWASFTPDESGPDRMYTFTSQEPSAKVASVLEKHGIENSTIEPNKDGGVTVYVGGTGDSLVSNATKAASELGAEDVGEYAGTYQQGGKTGDRDEAVAEHARRIGELESAHPEWRQARQTVESGRDYNTFNRLASGTEKPFVIAEHGSRVPDLVEVSPEKYGTGPQRGAESSRRTRFPDLWENRSYYRMQGTNAERFYGGLPHQYRAQFNAENLYDFANDPDDLRSLVPAKMVDPAERATAYEKLIKENGYDGYYTQDGQIAAFKGTPVEKIAQNGTLFSKGPRTWKDMQQHLLPEDLQRYGTEEKKEKFLQAVNSVPNADEWDAAVKAGMSGSLWYERSSRAFDALLKAMPNRFAAKDKTKFLNFVSALSPVQPVRSNLLMAINLWDKWDEAGRPTDVEWLDDKNYSGVKSKNAKLYRILQGRGNTYGVDLRSRLFNAIRALQGQPMSGPKVSAFAPNLGEDVDKSTNDTWMAVFAGIDPNEINKPHNYDAVSAMVREAGKKNGIPTRQAQAAGWSFIKSLAEVSGWGKDRWRPPEDIVKQGLLTPDLINQHAADFADLLANDKEIRARIEQIGGNLAVLDRNLNKLVPERPAANEGPASEVLTRLLGAARRLEAARAEGKIASHLAAKSDSGGQGGLFDTSFNPDSPAFSKQAPSDELQDLRDEYQRKLGTYARNGLNESGTALNLTPEQQGDLSKSFRAMLAKFRSEYPNAGGEGLVDFSRQAGDFAFSRAPKEQLDNYMNDLWKNSHGNPFDDRERIIGGAGVEMYPFDGMMHLSFIRTLDPEKGHGSAALKAITDLADKHDVAISLNVQRPKGMKGLTNAQLWDWYRRNGFVKTSGDEMVREPQPPSGTDSPAFSKAQITSPEFKQWFGDWEDPHAWSSKKEPGKPDVSMAVEPGASHKPLVLYHATPQEFSAFETGRPSKNYGTFGSWDVTRPAIFLATDPQFSERYIEDASSSGRRSNASGFKTGSRVMPLYANIKYPLDLRDSASGTVDQDFLNDLEKHGVNPRWFMNGGKSWELFDDEDENKNGTRFVNALQQMGHDGAIITEDDDEGNPHDVWVAFNPNQIKSAIGNRGTFDPSNNDVAFHISPQQALETNVPVEMPSHPDFENAVKNTPGAEITPDGLKINLVRRQKSEQEGEQSVRTGVFYLPQGSSRISGYGGSGNYGGPEKFTGPTLIRRPLFVKGATGGKAPEAAFDALMGKGAAKQLGEDAMDALSARYKAKWGNADAGDPVEVVRSILTKYGGDPSMAEYILRHSQAGNQLRYALQENIIAHAARNAGYDAVIGYSKKHNGTPFISEVFDTREQTYPSHVMPSQVHESFDPSFAVISALRAEAARRRDQSQ